MHLPEGVDYQYKGGIPGLYDEKGRLIKKAEDLTPQQLSDFERDYRRRRGEAQINIDRQVQELEKKSQEEKRQKNKPKPKPDPKLNAPAPPTLPDRRQPAPSAAPPVTSDRRQPAPAPARQPAPQASPVAAYMRAAAAARKSGDPAQMAAVRDQGLEIWRKKYADTLAKKVSPTGQQLGTGQSVMAKQAAELRALRPVKTPEAPVNTSVTTTAAPAPQPTVKTDTAAQRAREAQKPIPPEVKPFKATKIENSKRGTSTGTLAASYEYDAYDLVLEYLISNGHADTFEEANYVMLQMNAEHIRNIVEGFPTIQGTLNPWEDPKTGKSGIKIKSVDKSGTTKEYGPLKGGVFIKQAQTQKKPTTQVAHFEPEGEVIDERLIDKLNQKPWK